MLPFWVRNSGKDSICSGSFHEAFGSVLIVAQCLAMLPVTGVKGSSAYGLRFSWRSYRTIYSVIALGFATLYTIFATCITLTKPVTFNSFGVFCFISFFLSFFLHWVNFIETIFDCSATSILFNHSIWSVEFYSISPKMAGIDAALGICRINSTTLH